MEMTFDDTITERLTALQVNPPGDLVLDFDHTLSNDLVQSSCCGVTRYRIVAVDKSKVPDVFDGTIDSPLGKIYCKAWGKMYFDDNMNVRVTNNNLIEIMGDGERIAPHIEIVDYRSK